jgi:hypothetical protein
VCHALLDGPVESVEGENTELSFVVAVTSTGEQKLSQLGYVLTKKRDFLLCGALVRDYIRRLPNLRTYKNEKRLKDIKELTSALLVCNLDTLANDIDHGGKKLLERFLE